MRNRSVDNVGSQEYYRALKCYRQRRKSRRFARFGSRGRTFNFIYESLTKSKRRVRSHVPGPVPRSVRMQGDAFDRELFERRVDRGHTANFVKGDGEKHLLPLFDLRTACTAISPDDQMVQPGDSATSRVLPWIIAQPMPCVPR